MNNKILKYKIKQEIIKKHPEILNTNNIGVSDIDIYINSNSHKNPNEIISGFEEYIVDKILTYLKEEFGNNTQK